MANLWLRRGATFFAYFGIGIECKGVLKVVNCISIDMYRRSSFTSSVTSDGGILKKDVFYSSADEK